MKKIMILILALLCLNISCLVYATDVNLNDVKAKITLRPEDIHPDGINMEVGTASFWFEVNATVSGESGETISYQWYESKTGKEEDIKPIKNETNSIFVPDQEIGTTYYCVGVTTTLGDEFVTEYTKLLEATFTPKIIDKVWITNVKEPAVGEKPSNLAMQYTDYELNNYYGYEITSVKWTPEDKVFKEDVAYTIEVEIEYWDNVEFANDVDAKINEMEAKFKPNTLGESALVSYTFEKLTTEKQDENSKIDSGELIDDIMQNEEIEYAPSDDDKLDLSAIILCTIFAVLMVFALIVILNKR